MKNTKQNIFIFMIFTVFCISALGSVSAADTGNNTTTNNTTNVTANFTNPGFESGNLTGWTAGSTTTITTNSHSGTYGAHFNNIANQTADNLTQTVDLTNVNNITFWGYGEETAGTTYSFYVYIDNNLIESFIPTSDAWTQYTIPTSEYTGLHNVTVTWYGQCMYGTDVDDFSINAPTANFTTNTTNGTSPLTVQFNDTSTDKPTSWLWNFGDGTTSNLQNPTHTYTTSGIYTVTLTVTNAAANNTLTQTNYITVMDTTMPITVANNNTGPYNTTLNIILTTIDPYGATTTYYTTDGTDPQTSSTRTEYTGPLTISTTTTLRYSAINSKNIWSPEYTQTYTLDFIVPTVTSNLNNGTYNTTQTITLTTTDSNSKDTTYYTTDGTDPRTSSTRITYTEPITINKTTTLRYVAVDPAGNWSPLYIQNYIIGNETIETSTNTSGQLNYTGPSTNTTYWTYAVGDSMTDSVVTVSLNGTIYVGTWNIECHEGALYAFNSNGTLLWKYNTYGGIRGSPTIGSDGTIYVGSYFGVVYAINPDGTLKWEYNATESVIHYITSPLVIGPDGTIYVSICNLFPGFYAFNPDGTVKWTQHAKGSITIDSNGIIYCGSSAFNEDGTSSSETLTTSTSEIVGSDGTIYTINWGTITAKNPNGTTKWNYTVNGEIGSCLIGSDGTLYFGSLTALQGYGVDTAGSDLYSLNPNGTVKWTYHTGGSLSLNIASDGTLYVIGRATGVLYAIKDIPVANFTTNTTNYTTSQSIQFTDNSTNATSWTWNFGDGTTSTLQNPTHTYTTPGTYTVTLTASNNVGNSTKTSSITVLDVTAPTITVNSTGGLFNTTQNVTLTTTDNSGNSTTYYTTDGTDPQNSSTRNVYINSIQINNTTTLRYTAVDATGNWSPIYTQNYTIDTTAPTVKVVDPINSASNVAVNKIITVTFNEPIKTGNGWIELKNNKGTVIPSTWSINGNVLTITPSTALSKGVKYTLLIHTGSVTDLAGNNIAGYVSRFTTSTDNIAPTVKTVNPTNNAVNVAANKVIKVTFNEAIQAGTGWIELTSNNGTVIPSTWSINGNVLTITANNTLTHGVKYTLLIHTGSVTDLAGNNVKGYVSRFTVDSIAPTVKTVDPTNNAVNVAANKVIKVTFNETIKTGTDWIELTNSNGTVIPSTWSINGNVLTITLTNALSKGVKYTLLIHTGSVTDLAGNNVKGYVTRFTT